MKLFFYKIKSKFIKYFLIKKEIKNIGRLIEFYNNDFSFITDSYKNSEISLNSTSNSRIVWFMWWQGRDSMPEIIKINYQSLVRNKGEYVIRFIDQVSYREYLEIPILFKKRLFKVKLV